MHPRAYGRHVPHFEKMLYDNPQLAAAYLAAFQLTGDQQYATVGTVRRGTVRCTGCMTGSEWRSERPWDAGVLAK